MSKSVHVCGSSSTKYRSMCS